MRAALLGLLTLSLLAPITVAEAGPEEATLMARECKLPDCVIVDPRGLEDLLKANKKLADQVDAQARELDRLRASKGCAKVQIVPDRHT